MPTNKLLILFLAALLFALGSCRIVETGSAPRTVFLKIDAANPASYAVFLHQGAGKFAKCGSKDGAHYEIKVPMMEGGYRAFLFIKYNVHSPLDYKIIQARAADKIVHELSLRDIDALPRDKQGYRALKL